MKKFIFSLSLLLHTLCIGAESSYLTINVEVSGLEKIASELKAQGESMKIYLESMTNTLSRIADKDELSDQDRKMVNHLSDSLVKSSTLINDSIGSMPFTIKESNQEILAILDAAFTNTNEHIEFIKTEHISPVLESFSTKTKHQINKIIVWSLLTFALIVLFIYIIMQTKVFKPLYELVSVIRDFPEQWNRATENLRELNDGLQESMEISKKRPATNNENKLVKDDSGPHTPLNSDTET